MKFRKEFASQVVPEWQDAYMDYKSLKTVLKDVLNTGKRMETSSPRVTTPRGSALKRKASLYRAYDGLTSRYRNSPVVREQDEEVILVSSVREQGSSEAHYQTTLLMSSGEVLRHEGVFFRRLDEEFNKVVKFYMKKVEEAMDEADELTRQMNALIALRVKVDRPNIRPHGNNDSVSEQSQVPTSHRAGRESPGKGSMAQTIIRVYNLVESK